MASGGGGSGMLEKSRMRGMSVARKGRIVSSTWSLLVVFDDSSEFGEEGEGSGDLVLVSSSVVDFGAWMEIRGMNSPFWAGDEMKITFSSL